MSIDWTTAAWFLPFVLPITVWVAWSDMATMKIPNKAVLALLAVFIVVGLVALPFNDYVWRYLHFGVVIVIGFIMASVGMMGAGDAKYGAAMAPFIALQDLGVSFSCWVRQPSPPSRCTERPAARTRYGRGTQIGKAGRDGNSRWVSRLRPRCSSIF